MKRTFETPTPPMLDLRLPSGRITLEASPIAVTEVELNGDDDPSGRGERFRVEMLERGKRPLILVDAGGRFRSGSGRDHGLRIRCPQGSEVELQTRSAKFEGRGRLGSFGAKTASGELWIDEVDGPATIHSASGDVRIRVAGGPAEIHSSSGDLAIGRALGSVRAYLASGDLVIGHAEGPVETSTASGDQSVEAVGPGSVRLRSVSGDLRVHVPRGIDVWLDLQSVSGEVSSGLSPTERPAAKGTTLLELRLKSVSGDISVERADPGRPAQLAAKGASSENQM